MGESDDERRRLLVKAVAKIGVLALVIGLLVALCTLGLVKVLGLDDGGTKNASVSGGPPSPLPSHALDVPSASSSASSEPTETPKTKIVLNGPAQAGSMSRIDLSGTYSGHPNGVLRVQRLEGDQWQDFAGVTARVHGGSFTTYVQTGHTGANVFRVFDDSAKLASNKVSVTVG